MSHEEFDFLFLQVSAVFKLLRRIRDITVTADTQHYECGENCTKPEPSYSSSGLADSERKRFSPNFQPNYKTLPIN